ncbi:MAG: ABC transporter permease [Actinomycetales bacterium]|nr:MAG: ABC transporter permease [Actinomycetales bacterium]
MKTKLAGLSFLFKDTLTTIATVMMSIFIGAAIFAPWLAPFPKEGAGETNVDNIYIGPGWHHLLGTDELGRDLLSRIIYGARPALLIALAVVGFAAIIGTLLGLIAGYRGGWIDNIIMRVSELFLSFPPLLLSLVAVTFLGPGLVNALIALIISWWPWYARLIRVEASIVRSKPYVEISAAMGVPDRIIIVRHILRNVTTPLIVQIAADLGTVILAAGSLAFIGLGAQPPSADWGLMVAQGRNLIFDQWWISTFSGLAIFLAVLSFNIIGDALRDHFDPRIARQ